MNPIRLGICLAGLAALAAGLSVRADGADGPPREFTFERRNVPGSLRSVRLRDVDGDGVTDLVFVTVDGRRREMGFFRGRRRGGFDEAPSHRLRLKSDVVLVGLGDLDPAPGVEFVLLTRSSVFVYRHAEPSEQQRYRRLFRETLFFSFADPDDAPVWPHIRDLDGDGLEDVCVPGWDGFVFRFQDRGPDGVSEFTRRSAITAWIDRGRPASAGGRMNVSIGFGGERYQSRRSGSAAPVGGLMVESVRRMSSPVLADENGDGRVDLQLLEGRRLRVWRQGEDHRFPAAPSLDQDLDKVLSLVPRWARTGNVCHADVNGDGRTDYLVRQAVEQSVRTRLLLFTGGVRSLAEAPVRIFVLNGLTAGPRFRDVNGDGRLDLLVPTYRLDLLQRARRAVVRSLDVTLYVFLNRGELLYPPRPDYSRTESLRTERLAEAGMEPMVFLDGDFNQDGRADLLVVDEEDHLKIFLSTETRGGLFRAGGAFTFEDRPSVSVPIEVPGEIQLLDQNGDGVSEVLLLYERAFALGGWGLGKEQVR